MPPMMAHDALALLRLHRHRVHGVGKPSGGPIGAASPDAVVEKMFRFVEKTKRSREVRERLAAKRVEADGARREGPE